MPNREQEHNEQILIGIQYNRLLVATAPQRAVKKELFSCTLLLSVCVPGLFVDEIRELFEQNNEIHS